MCIHYETMEFATREGLRNHNFDIHKKWTLSKSIYIYIYLKSWWKNYACEEKKIVIIQNIINIQSFYAFSYFKISLPFKWMSFLFSNVISTIYALYIYIYMCVCVWEILFLSQNKVFLLFWEKKTMHIYFKEPRYKI